MNVPCEHCGGPTNLKLELPPLGREPGHSIYECDSCSRHTWTKKWRKTPEPPLKEE
jgi:hypothetical protein